MVEVVPLVAVERVVGLDVVAGGEQEAARAAGRVADRLAGGGLHDVDDGLDERARGEILPGAGFGVLGVLLQQAFVDLAFDVHLQPDPGLAVDQLHQALQLGRVLDAVLGLAEDDRDQPRALAQSGERLAVVALQLFAGEPAQAGPAVPGRDGAGFAQNGGVLVVHLQEEQVGELLQVIAVRHAVVAQHVAVVPHALHDGGRLAVMDLPRL